MSSPANCQLRSSHWASLHEDLVMLVGGRVLAGDLLDYVRFRAVCTYWRSSTICPRGRGIADPRFHPRRWMMLPEGHGPLHPHDDGGGNKRRFLNLSTGAFVRPRLPLLANHRVMCTVEGLLLLGKGQDRYHPKDITMCLLHPFTGDVAELPPFPLLVAPLRRHLDSFVCDGMTVSLSVGMDGVAAVMITHLCFPHVLFATTKDKQWSCSSWSLGPTSSRVISFQGNLYAVQMSVNALVQQVLQIGPPLRCEGDDGPSLWLPPPNAIVEITLDRPGTFDLAECDSEILVIVMDSTDLLVYRLADLVLGKIAPLTNIGGNAIFLDIGPKIASPLFGRSITTGHKVMPTIEGDTVVRRLLRERYVGLNPRERYVEQYHLSTRTRTPTASGYVEDPCGSQCVCGLVYHIYGNCCCAFSR